MSKNILFLVTELDSASGICVQNVARELIQRGNTVSILTKAVKPSALPYQISCGAWVYAVSGNWIDRIRIKYRGKETPTGKLLLRLAVTAERIGVVLCYPVWPLKDFSLCVRFGRKARELADFLKIDAVIPVYNTVDALIAAESIKKRKPGTVYIPYLLDSFYGGQTPRLMSENRKREKALRWEQKLFRRADGIVMMQSARNSYESSGISPEYLHRTVFLDIPMLCQRQIQPAAFDSRNSVFLFAGSMPRNIRDPEYVLNLFQCVKEPGWQLLILGSSDFERTIADAARKDPRIKSVGTVPHGQAVKAMEEADILVNIGNTLSYMVPSKIFEYMSFNKPIVSSCKIPDDPCLPYLKLYGKALVVDEKCPVEESARALRAFVEKLDRGGFGDLDVTQMIRPGGALHGNTPEAFADYLEKIFAAI